MSTLFLPATATVRRYLAFSLALLLAATALVIASASPAQAAPPSTTISGVTYAVDTDDLDAGAVVTDYDGNSGPVVEILSTVEIGGKDYPVLAIGENAFDTKTVTSVILPNGLVTIKGGAFFETELESVTLPNSLVTIGEGAFAGNQLKSVTLPGSLEAIGNYAFGRNQLVSVVLPDGLVTLGDGAFSENQLMSVTLPGSLEAIGNYAFGNNQLVSVVLPDGLVTLGDSAFDKNQLTSVVIPAGVTTVGQGAFSDNEHLSEVRFTGPAPSTITGADYEYVVASLGTAAGLKVRFPAQYLAQSGQGGYTTPQWLGYDAYPVNTVAFDTGGGVVVEPVIVSWGERVELPADPVREGYIFTGWYTSPGGEDLFDSELPVTADLTLYAGWQRSTPGWISSVSGSLGSLSPSSAGS